MTRYGSIVSSIMACFSLTLHMMFMKQQFMAKTSGKDQQSCSPPTITNGVVSPNEAIKTGFSYTVSCDAGYYLNGSGTINCTTDDLGQATTSVLPTCDKGKLYRKYLSIVRLIKIQYEEKLKFRHRTLEN